MKVDTLAERESGLAKVIRFSARPEFKEMHEKAFKIFWGEWLLEQGREALTDVMRSEQVQIAYNGWFIFDLDLGNNRTVVDSFLEREGAQIEFRGAELSGDHAGQPFKALRGAGNQTGLGAWSS